MSAVAIIPARGGSRRIKKKNIRLFHGKPIIAYSIVAARASCRFADIIVSTDSGDIWDVAIEYGASVIKRDPKLADDVTGTQRVMQDAIDRLVLAKISYSHACCIYATAPLMAPGHLISGYDQLIKGSAPYVYTVGPDFRDAGQWYWGTSKAFRDGLSLDQAAYYMLPAERACDINVEEDWMRAERMYEALHGAE